MRYWRARDDWKIVCLLDGGLAPKEVARELGIAVWSVYRANKRFVVKKKLDPLAVQALEEITAVRSRAYKLLHKKHA